jgi:protein disulfide-isomerase
MKISKAFVLSLLLLITVALTANAAWTEDYAKALATAKADKKMILLDFTGSDWCPWCVKLEKDVYATPAFQNFAAKNLVLVKLDFPQSKPQSDQLKQQNEKLQTQFAVEGFPTTVLLDSNGKKLGQLEGYVEGGPTAFLKKLDDLANGKPVAQ